METSPFFIGKSTVNKQCSIAMLVYQRVSVPVASGIVLPCTRHGWQKGWWHWVCPIDNLGPLSWLMNVIPYPEYQINIKHHLKNMIWHWIYISISFGCLIWGTGLRSFPRILSVAIATIPRRMWSKLLLSCAITRGGLQWWRIRSTMLDLQISASWWWQTSYNSAQ